MSKKFFDPEPRVFAHRGASGAYPENTLASFREAVKIGVDVIETDVHFTRDRRFVVAHDGELGRICDGSGAVEDYTLAELKKFDAGYGFSTDGGTVIRSGAGGSLSSRSRSSWRSFPISVSTSTSRPKIRRRCRITATSLKMRSGAQGAHRLGALR
jgi:glycerophosphoryl diester phosphodiesterase